MYKLITPDGEFLTEKPNFIRKHSNNCFILTERSKAEGIAYHGTPYMFADGAMCYEVDSGEDIQNSKTTEALTLELAADHEARLCMIELGV
jgi:hypothetical protein